MNRRTLILLAGAGTLGAAAHADSLRLFAQSPHNGTINMDGSIVQSGMYVSNNPTYHERVVAEFDLSDFAALAGQVVVHSARFDILSPAIGPGVVDRLAFYGYEADGLVTSEDYGRGDLIERLDHGAPLSEYFGVDVTAWLQGALDDGFDWAGFNIRNESDILSVVNIYRDNWELSWTTIERAPRLTVEYSILGIPAIPLPGAGALAGAGLVALGARRRRALPVR